jgi:exodeoxyribonuclease-5
MELTRKQEEGLRIALDRYYHNEPYTVVAGYAGTGKSTLIKFIIEALDINPENVAYIAYTGKAAQVLRNKGCPNAMTAHRLLYHSKQRPDGTYFHIPKDDIGDYRLIVVDEVSMLPRTMWELLLGHKKYVIACGDPGQLPPVSEEDSPSVLDNPHIFLDEIMRQAKDSEIILLSSDIRARKPISPFKGTEVNIVRKRDAVDGMLTWADQILCGKNNTRYQLNSYFRKMKWGNDVSDAPLVGDKIICRKNNWDKINRVGDAIVNGSIGTLDAIYTTDNPWLGKKCIINFLPDKYDEDDSDQDILFRDLLIDWKLITTNEFTVTKENFRMFPKWLRPEQFEYGYAITCHKSQGSEYDKVLVFEEMLKATDHARWLYTAVTRAAKRLTLVLKD